MATSTVLGIVEIEPNQNNKYLSINEAISVMENSSNKVLPIAVGAGPVTLTQAQFTGTGVVQLNSATAAFNLIVPNVIDGVNPANRVLVIHNNTTFSCTLKTSAVVGTFVVFPPSSSGLAYVLADDVFLATATTGSVGGTNPYDIGLFIPNLPEGLAGEELLRMSIGRSCTFSDAFAGSVGSVKTPPTAATSWEIRKNGIVVGNVLISTAGVVTFTTVAVGDVAFASGDVLTLLQTATQDTTLADVSINLQGERI